MRTVRTSAWAGVPRVPTKRWMKHQGHEACDLETNPIDREKDCPIRKLERFLTQSNMASPSEIDAIAPGIEREIDAAIRFAESSPYPNPELQEI